MTLHTVLFYFIPCNEVAGQDLVSRAGRLGAGAGAPVLPMTPPDALLTPNLSSCGGTSALKRSGFPLSCRFWTKVCFLGFLFSFFFFFCLPLTLGPQKVGQRPPSLNCLPHIVLHSRVQGAPVLASPSLGPGPSESVLGWNKGVNIYNFFIPVVKRGAANVVFYKGDTDVYFGNPHLQAQYCDGERGAFHGPPRRLVMQREPN